VALPPPPAIVFNGSDALGDVAQAILSDCSAQFPDLATSGVGYEGGGSGVGVSQMLTFAQQIAPMSRPLAPAEYCATSGAAAANGAAPGLSESLLIGLDGVSILANKTNSCSSAAANGVGAALTFVVTNDGTATGGTPATCPGCDASNGYTFGAAGSALYAGQPSFDALAVIYFGLTHDGTYNCASPVRRSLIKNWKNLFASDCAAGDGTCTSGLTHAWRLGDLSGTTDALVSILNPPGRGLGTLPNVPLGAAQRTNPFCNSFDANHSGATSFAGASDDQDLDPVRTLCITSATNVCQEARNLNTQPANFSGDLGVVLPIVLPDSATVQPSDVYPTASCGTSCALVAPIKSTFMPSGFTCPGSRIPPNQGYCFLPIDQSGDPRCVSNNQSQCFDVVGKQDGRAYNRVVVIDQRQLTGVLQKYKQPGSPYQMALDANGRIIDGAFYRLHAQNPGAHNVPDASVGTTGLCTELDAVSQVGCLTDSEPCSVGYGSRSAASFYPGLGTPAIPQPAPLKALAVNGTPPFTPPSVSSDANLAIENLLAAPGTTPLYPLARRLYLSTIYGFASLPSLESELAACFGNNAFVGPAMTSSGLVPVPGGVQCLDYPEEAASTATPLPNVQGPGNVAFAGCGSGLAGQNACQASPPIIQ
jgi:hypothetical protein